MGTLAAISTIVGVISQLRPSDAKKKGIQGSVIANFTVKPDGSIEDIDIERANPDLPSFKKGVVRLLKSMPKWIPAFINENPVRSYQNINIKFKLPEGK